ncbi:MAG TPA: type II secretion system protein, partial [Candidatus Synoicihabitans sp.]|nr:type II secretion system protein [Candidatus Synoicihabitans sp.]
MRRGARRGVSLLELVVALAVTAMLATLLIVVTINVTDHWRRRADRQSATTQVALALDQLEADLRGWLPREPGVATFIATVQPDAPGSSGHAGMSGETWRDPSPARVKPAATAGSRRLPNPTEAEPIPALENSRFGQVGTWLRLVTLAPDRETGTPATRETLPVAVAYQLVRRANAPGQRAAYRLYRSQVAARATLNAGYDLLAPAYVLPDDHEGSPGSLRRPALHDLLAEGVVDFGVRVMARQLDGTLVVRFPTDGNLEIKIDAPSPETLIVEVFVRILTEDGCRRLAAYE